MFTNPYREMCVNILEKLLPRRAVQDSTLLQAYATFHMMKEVRCLEPIMRRFIERLPENQPPIYMHFWLILPH